MPKNTPQARELTDEMFEALEELGKEVERDHLCDRCLSKMNLSVGFVGGLRIVLYECKSCEHVDMRELIK